MGEGEDIDGSPNIPGSSFNHFHNRYIPQSSLRHGSLLLARRKVFRLVIFCRISLTSHSGAEEMRLLDKSRVFSLVSIWIPDGMAAKRLLASFSSFMGDRGAEVKEVEKDEEEDEEEEEEDEGGKWMG